MSADVPGWAGDVAAEQPYPLIFATVSGAHLHGFASVDSDLDLRAAHVLPAAEVVGLRTGPATIDIWVSRPPSSGCSSAPGSSSPRCTRCASC
jgi:hypothetical protein